jgi:hypothetical protein
MEIPERKLLFQKQRTCYSRSQYRSLLVRYDDPVFYSGLLHDIRTKQKLLSSEEISLFREKLFRQITAGDIRRAYGKPGYRLRKSDPFKREILFYQVKLGLHRANLELHFSDDELFFYSYSFPCLKNEDRIRVLQIIESKYLEGERCDFEKYTITDDSYNYISIRERGVLTINYIRFASAFFEELALFMAKQEADKEMARKRTVEHLFERL